MTAAGAAAGSADRRATSSCGGADRRRAVRSGHVRLHRGAGRRARSSPATASRRSSRSPTRCRRSSTRCARRCCRAWSTPSRTTAGTAGATSRCSRSARASRPRRRDARRRARLDRRRRQPSTGRAAAREVDFFDVKGVVEQLCDALGVAVALRAGSTSRFSSPGQAASIVCADRRRPRVGVVGQVAPAIADARGLPRQDAVFVAELDLDRAGARARRRRATRRGRCRAIRSSSAICRSSSPTPCLRRSFVAPFRRPARDVPAPLVAISVLRSLSGQGRAGRRGQPVGAADVSGGRSHADRRGSAAERRRRFWRALVQRARRGAAITIGNQSELMTMAKTATRSVELEPIDRLEEKLKLLVGMVERMKAEQARAAEENQRLSRELDAMRARLASSDGARRRAVGAEGRARRHPHARRRHARAARSAESVTAAVRR